MVAELLLCDAADLPAVSAARVSRQALQQPQV